MRRLCFVYIYVEWHVYTFKVVEKFSNNCLESTIIIINFVFNLLNNLHMSHHQYHRYACRHNHTNQQYKISYTLIIYQKHKKIKTKLILNGQKITHTKGWKTFTCSHYACMRANTHCAFITVNCFFFIYLKIKTKVSNTKKKEELSLGDFFFYCNKIRFSSSFFDKYWCFYAIFFFNF